MKFLSRFVSRRRRSDRGRYLCTLCGAQFEDSSVVVCPKCKGFVVEGDG